ncbi:Adenylate cyclase, class 3 [Chelatococcus sambhunathii]|uniref:Adenylate cyclase, class 3 n=1 Tax=Chelatococcus sambhunathii TaxID=363953 RepID=A0ABM9U7W7_9HYPH|nr:adenylate/guanylate cyclase domain-containing protein [Chelatococcus sambhunathii]CUA89922.1 Adenylate cyclase, class 3 [Chelatococcus sambhunathii]
MGVVMDPGDKGMVATMAGQSCEIGILFGDISGSTQLYEVLGDRAALAAIEGCLRAATGVVTAHGGAVVKTIGDELMAAFPDPAAMFDAALAMQRCMETQAGPEGAKRLALRIGFHYGPAIRTGADYFGNTVNVAARMVQIARAGQIITSGDLAGLLPPAQRAATRELTRFSVKGKSEATRIVEVVWQESGGLTAVDVLSRSPPTVLRPLLQLDCAGIVLIFEGEREVTLGRDAGNDLVVAHDRVSRRHATLGLRRDRWMLTDHSTNGSFIAFDGEPERPLHLDAIDLHGAGTIGLGQPAALGGGVRFSVLLRRR